MSLLLEQYTEKSIAVFGTTEPHKENLKTLGGKYNANLRGRPGWIFPNSAWNRVEEFVKSVEAGGQPVVKPRPQTSASAQASAYSGSQSSDIIETLLKRIEALELKVFGASTSAPVVTSPSVTSSTVKKPAVFDSIPEEECEKPKRLLRK